VQGWGTLALAIGAIGVMVWAVAFLGAVRWWSDMLGRVLASVFGSMGVMCAVITVVTFGIPVPALVYVRAALYSAFAVSVWGGVIAFLWAQFAAPRLRRRRDHTPQ
jgi:hypothetical protein